MRILSIQQVALTTDPDGTEVPLVFENGVFYKIFGNGFESAPFNHDSVNVNFLPVGQGYPSPMLGVITNGKLKLYTTYAPVDYVQLLEFADDSYTFREEVRESVIDLTDATSIHGVITEDGTENTFNVESATLKNPGIALAGTFSKTTTGAQFEPESYVCYGRKYYPWADNSNGAMFTLKLVDNTLVTNFRFVRVVSHDDYS